MDKFIDKIINSFKGKRKYFTYVIILYVIINLAFIVVIWWPKDVSVNKYQSINLQDKQNEQTQVYLNTVYDIFKNNKKEILKSLISEDYAAYISKSKDDIVSDLIGENFFSNKVQVRGIELFVDENTYIYSMTLYSSNGSSRRLNVIETFPYKYSIVFDDFYDYKEMYKTVEKQGIKFTILSVYKNLKYIEYNIRIENLNDYYVSINFNDATQVQAITSDSHVYSAANLVSTSNLTNIDSNSLINKKIAFQVPAQLQNGVKLIRFKNVVLKYSNSIIDIDV